MRPSKIPPHKLDTVHKHALVSSSNRKHPTLSWKSTFASIENNLSTDSIEKHYEATKAIREVLAEVLSICIYIWVCMCDCCTLIKHPF